MAMGRMEERTHFNFEEALLLLMSQDNSAMADILLGPVDEVPVKFYDATLGTI